MSESAKVYTGIRDVATYIGEVSPGRRWWGGPWRPAEWGAITVIGGPTWWLVAHRPLGTTLPALLIGGSLMVATVVGMRLFLPKNRPSLMARAVFAGRMLRPQTGVYPTPEKVVGNLVYTGDGVYAEYLFDGLSSALDSEASHADAARLTRNLGRYLPSGTMLRALLVPEDTISTVLRMVGGHIDKPEWVKQCRRWEPIIANPSAAHDLLHDPASVNLDEFNVPARQRFWMSVPVDCGTMGRTRLRPGLKLWEWVRGRDHDSQASVDDYGRTAAAIVSGLPGKFNIRPATPAQIGWYYRHRAGLGVSFEPMPAPGDVDDTPIPAIAFDEADNAGNPWWRLSLQPLIRVGRSYQTFLTVEHFPKTGVKFPRSYYLHTLLRLNSPAVIEWTQHLNVRTPDEARPINRRKRKNIRDQLVQRGPDSETNNELFDKLDNTEEYATALESSPAERELDHTVIIAVAAADPGALDEAVTMIRHELDSAGIVVGRRRGAQAALSFTFLTGAETHAPLDEFRNPTTAHLWSLFLHFITGWTGDVKGSPMAVDQSTAHPAIIFNDPEGCARRNQPTGCSWVGDPGGGKSNATKLGALEVVMRGGRVVVFEPDEIGEWAAAFNPFTDLGVRVVDPATSRWCYDPLLMMPGDKGRDMAAAHILPWIGLPVNHDQAKRYRRLLREGHPCHAALLTHLRGLPGADSDALLDRLESAAEDFPGIFDDRLPVYRPDESAATVYLMGRMDLPDPDEITSEHLFMQMDSRKRAGMAIYGLLVDLEQRFMFSRSDRYDLMIFEEAAEMCAYPAGARIVHLISKRGRKHGCGIWVITQDFRAIARANDKFIRQKRIFRITDRDLAFDTLRWAGFDVETPNDGLVTELCENTSPGNRRERDDNHGEAGGVDPWRRGEGFIVDALGRRTRCQFLQAPSLEQAQAFDSTPLLGAL